MNEKIKISYNVSGYPKFVTGTLVSEDELFFEIKARDGVIFLISKETITEIRKEGHSNDNK